MRETPNWNGGCDSRRGGTRCYATAHYAYRAMGGGWAVLCDQHGAPHVAYSITRTGGHGNMVDVNGNCLTPRPAPHGGPR
jgi:hypothetical protein